MDLGDEFPDCDDSFIDQILTAKGATAEDNYSVFVAYPSSTPTYSSWRELVASETTLEVKVYVAIVYTVQFVNNDGTELYSTSVN